MEEINHRINCEREEIRAIERRENIMKNNCIIIGLGDGTELKLERIDRPNGGIIACSSPLCEDN